MPSADSGAETGTSTDGGPPVDASASLDAAGTEAGPSMDATMGADAGGATDAGTSADAGALLDAGMSADAGVAPDAGPGADAGPLRPTFPFGGHRQRFTAGTIAPTGTTVALDEAAASFYRAWKSAYLRPGCEAGTYYVTTAGATSGATVSEAHGYGMIIAALAAGLDPEARTIFDGMHAFYLQHPSDRSPVLMAWNQNAACASINGRTTATDGDLDIAYALLLADRQWGSDGAVDYAAAARRILEAILRFEIHPTGHAPLLADWAAPPNRYAGTLRMSDSMPDHFRAFRAFTGEARWGLVLDAALARVEVLQTSFSRRMDGTLTGLVPDFATGADTASPAPATAGWYEGPNDGSFTYVAARVPWRLGMDHLSAGDPRVLASLRRLNTWARDASAGDPARLLGGYTLAGTALPGAGVREMVYLAPLAVAAAAEADNQRWLDALWAAIVARPITAERYLGNTVKLLSMFALSRNTFAP